ncbi:PREDICTED: golgin subfamily A member 5 [Trachymyrmex cornetzi]|uniref:Golgin subfamily A member 5 n=1 Tax=Trachymyrmex cornetzi TaxID=471704 RepID=A0A195DMQ7_9HYME|nr:PREDICTED: golgin subfamily A member 5 [Trachymyrmex cornetzi]KYN14158.1 Golgin subfamily A member 5 [Trachymyrmex cornetzi]
MAWLSGLADKAENLLNKIDKNTAAVLNKDKYEMPQGHLSEVTWLSPESGLSGNTSKTPLLGLSDHIPYVAPTSGLTSVNLLNVTTPNEDALFTYLNTPDPSPKRIVESFKSPSTTSSLLVEHPTDTDSDLSIQSDRISPTPSHVSIEMIPNILNDKDAEINMENSNLYPSNEVQTLNCENLDNPTTEIIQNEHNNAEDHLDVFSPQPRYKIKSNNVKTDDLDNPIDLANKRKYIRELERHLEKQNEFLGKQTDFQKEIVVLNEKLKALEMEKLEQLKQVVDLQSIIDRNRQELNSIRSELEQHKARALKTLQEKEKLIAELKSNAPTAMDEATIMELNQLKQERDSVREENQQMCQQLKMLREELVNADLNLEKIRQKSAETNLQNQEILASERRRRLETEEDMRLHSEEIRSLKDELISQRNGFSLQLQKQNSEISRLKLQLSVSATPSNEMDSRIASLTQTLVLKQQALECLTTERNALRLQLEKIEHEYRNAAGNLRRNISYNNINDTDDAKAQVPTFLMETPFDTSVTRRVKRAYSSLDAISIRTGVFLRRYPLARILVLIYMALLQLWVFVVLFSQSPEAH